MERDKLLGTMDAKVWTDEFMATKARLGNKEFDHAMMLSWFANAIMAGFDEANRRAQRALDAERERVRQNLLTIMDLQAQVKDRDAMILQMGGKAAVLAKESMAVKAQLRQVEGERDAHAQDVDDLIDCCINDVLVTHATPGGKPHDPDPQIRPLRDKIAGSLVELQTLRQLVEALPVVDGRMDVECGACYYIRSFVAGQYGIVCGLITEQSTAMAIKALLEYRAALAAQDAGKAVSSG